MSAPRRSTDDAKRGAQLPAIRVSEPLELALHRLANHDGRSLSDYVRVVLERHVWGHGRTLVEDPPDGQQ